MRPRFDTRGRHARWSPSQTGGFPPGYSGFLPREDHPNANIGANKHD